LSRESHPDCRGAARGEARPGDPRLHVFSLIGPLFMAALFTEVFGEAGDAPPDLERLAEQHGHIILRGLLDAPYP
jgi:hypothetical protein